MSLKVMIRSDDCNELPPLSLIIKVGTWEVQITNPHVTCGHEKIHYVM